MYCDSFNEHHVLFIFLDFVKIFIKPIFYLVISILSFDWRVCFVYVGGDRPRNIWSSPLLPHY